MILLKKTLYDQLVTKINAIYPSKLVKLTNHDTNIKEIEEKDLDLDKYSWI